MKGDCSESSRSVEKKHLGLFEDARIDGATTRDTIGRAAVNLLCRVDTVVRIMTHARTQKGYTNRRGHTQVVWCVVLWCWAIFFRFRRVRGKLRLCVRTNVCDKTHRWAIARHSCLSVCLSVC